MRYAIEDACDALKKAIVEIQYAADRAKTAGDKAAERNLGENKVDELKNVLANALSLIPYITQPRFAKYFEN